MATLDRRAALQANATILGVDYLYVDVTNQVDLYVHFIRPPSPAQQAKLTIDRVSIVATATDAPDVAIAQAPDFPVVNGVVVMHIRTAAPGLFTRYTLRLANPIAGPPVLDPYLSSVQFSFKAGCYSDIDCDHEPHDCAPDDLVDFPVDYEARDFWSMRTALLDFASQRYPRWPDRLEADNAVMLAEVMSALGDELAYHQDRIAREAHLETTTQRRSLRRHARLVDYRVHDGLGATTWIDVTAAAAGTLVAGTVLFASRDGNRVDYSVGRNLDEMLANKTYGITDKRNAANLIPYQWDVHDVCVPAGVTELWLTGDVTAAIKPLDDTPPGRAGGRWMLLRTDPIDPALPARRHLVRVILVEKVADPLAGVDTTHIVWEPEQKLPFELEFKSLSVHGNVIPAVAGVRVDETFVIGAGNAQTGLEFRHLIDNTDRALPVNAANPPWAIERVGANGSVSFLFSLARSASDGVVRRGGGTEVADPRQATPELRLVEQVSVLGGFIDGTAWTWRHSMMDAPASLPLDSVFTLDDGLWRRIVGYQRLGGEFVQNDYASNDGSTIRFGDDVFGRIPPRGTRFVARYLVGNGRRANLPAGAITNLDPPLPALVAAVENPFAITDGVDPETPESVKQLAPEAFRAVTYRAVRPEDYAEAAERLPWVQRAGCRFRWTGSWQTAFVTPDPRHSVVLTTSERVELEEQLDRFRQAGRETHALAPQYADLDLQIFVCVRSDAYPAEVKSRVEAVLTGSPTAFFAADKFTFGTPLLRSRLEAVIQDVPGVRAVEGIAYRRRGFSTSQTLPDTGFFPADNEVVRVENDPLHPDRGSVQLFTDGGA